MTDEQREYREIQRLLHATSKAHRDARARDALVRRWLAGDAGWYSATAYMQRDGGVPFVPLAMPDAACPVRVALRHPARPSPGPRAPRTARRALLRAAGASHAHRGRVGYVCPVMERAAQVMRCIGAVASHQLLAPRPTIVGAGIDTLELHTKAPVGPHVEAVLAGVFARAEEARQPEPFELAGVAWSMHHRTIKGGMKFENAARDVVVRVRPTAESDEASVIVELHAAACWALGWREAGALAERICAAICPGADLDMQVTRLDLCVDWQGWQLTPEDRERFVTRAKKRGRYYESHVEPKWDDAGWLDTERRRVKGLARQLEKATSPEEVQRLLELLHHAPTERVTQAEYETGKHAFTGFAFGLGHHLSARAYNKSREIRRSRKGWFTTLWQRSEGYREPPGGLQASGAVRDWHDVWRLEFQLRREALKEFILDEAGAWRDLASWDECRKYLDDVWAFLTKRWLRHGWRQADDRLATSRSWQALRAARFVSEPCAALSRVIPEVGVQPVLSSVAGYISTGVAQLLELQTADDDRAAVVSEAETPGGYAALMSAVLQAAHDGAREPLAEVTEKKREKLRARAAFLARRCTAAADERRQRRGVAQRYGTFEGLLVKRDESDDRQEAMSAVWRAEKSRQEGDRRRAALEEAERTLPF